MLQQQNQVFNTQSTMKNRSNNNRQLEEAHQVYTTQHTPPKGLGPLEGTSSNSTIGLVKIRDNIWDKDYRQGSIEELSSPESNKIIDDRDKFN